MLGYELHEIVNLYKRNPLINGITEKIPFSLHKGGVMWLPILQICQKGTFLTLEP